MHVFRLLLLSAAALQSAAAHGMEIELGSVPLSYEHWTLSEDRPGGATASLDQYSLEVSVRARIASATRVRLELRPSWSTQDPIGGEKGNLDSISDVRVELSQRAGERLLLQAGVDLPTGHTGLSPKELSLAQVLAHPLLEMRVRTPGEGVGYRIGTIVGGFLSAQSTYSVGLGAVYRGSFELLEGQGDYQPTPEAALSAGIERRGGESEALGLDVTYRVFGADRWTGREVYREGDEIDLRGHWTGATADYQGMAQLRMVMKGNDTVVLPEGALRRELVQSPGTSTALQARLDRSLGARWRFGLTTEARVFSGSDLPGENGEVVGAGPTLTREALAGGQLRLACVLDVGGTHGAGAPDMRLRGFSVVAAYAPTTGPTPAENTATPRTR